MKNKTFSASEWVISGLTLLFAATFAQAQNNNPTGNAGFFNGNSSIGCSYDPYTANATRTIPDITVAGAVGSYPLQWARTMNSRNPGGSSLLFGAGGGWSHSYAWSLQDSGEWTGSGMRSPSFYVVSFPDGRLIRFTSVTTDTCFHGPLGVHERFQPLNLSSGLAYLVLADGGQVEFLATLHHSCDDVGCTS